MRSADIADSVGLGYAWFRAQRNQLYPGYRPGMLNLLRHVVAVHFVQLCHGPDLVRVLIGIHGDFRQRTNAVLPCPKRLLDKRTSPPVQFGQNVGICCQPVPLTACAGFAVTGANGGFRRIPTVGQIRLKEQQHLASNLARAGWHHFLKHGVVLKA